MNWKINVETGDVSATPPRLRSFQIEQNQNPVSWELKLDTKTAHLSEIQWSALRAATAKPSPSSWAEGSPQPFDNMEMREIAQNIDTTPIFQLFLAGVEITEILNRLVIDPSAELTEQSIIYGSTLSDISTDYGSHKGLYFIPVSLANSITEQIAQELLMMNKICRLQTWLEGDFLGRVFYVPYATPISAISDFTDEAYRILTEIRKSYRNASRSFAE